MSVFAGPEQLQAVDAAAVAGMARSGVPFLENLAAQEGHTCSAAALVVLSAPGGLEMKGFNAADVSPAAENVPAERRWWDWAPCFLMEPQRAFSPTLERCRPRWKLPGLRAPGRGGPGLRRSGAPRRPGADGCRYHLVQISKAEAAR